MASSPHPSGPTPTTTSIFDAVEELKDRAAGIYSILETSGDYEEMRGELGYVRDRADQIQNAVIGFIASINENL